MKKFFCFLTVFLLLLCGLEKGTAEVYEIEGWSVVGKFVEEIPNGEESGVPYESLYEGMGESAVYRFEVMASYSGDGVDHRVLNEYSIDGKLYMDVIMEKDYFEKTFEYGNYYIFRLKDVVGSKINHSILYEDTGKSEELEVSAKTNYDQDTGEYFEPVNAEQYIDMMTGTDIDADENKRDFAGMGYLEEIVADTDYLSGLHNDGVICKFHVLKNGRPAESMIDEEHIYVYCTRDFYEKNKDKGISTILGAYDYGLEYKGKKVYSLYTIIIQGYHLAVEDKDEMISWYSDGKTDDIEKEDNDSKFDNKGSGDSPGTGKIILLIVGVGGLAEIVRRIVTHLRGKNNERSNNNTD